MNSPEYIVPVGNLRFGEFIVFARRRLGITQQEFADRVGISRNRISQIENNQNISGLTMRTFMNLFRAMGLEIEFSTKLPGKDGNSNINNSNISFNLNIREK